MSARGRLTLIATGSRGDVQPQAALGRRLQQDGWEVRFATHRCFLPLVESAGLELFPLSGDSQSFFSGPAGVALREKLRDPHGAADWIGRILGPFIRRFFLECTTACADADAILFWPFSHAGAPLAEKLGIPCFGVSTYPLPYCRTRAFANPFFQPSTLWRFGHALGLAGVLNRRSWNQGEPAWGDAFRHVAEAWKRETLGLEPSEPDRTRRRILELPHLLGFSPTLLPPPRDWPQSLHVTGFWFLDLADHWQPPDDLLAFLADGPPPVAIGFGSMTGPDPTATTEIVLEAVRRSGVRSVLLSGWGGLSPSALPKEIFPLPEAPHDWLFPRVSAVVHHGGSGTTAAGLRAGVPALALPFGFDQFLWGRCLARAGVGPRPIPQKDLTPGLLAAALRELTTRPRLRERAAALGRRVREEDGVGRAAEIIARHVPTSSKISGRR